MALEKVPFKLYDTSDKEKNYEVISVRINQDQRKILDQSKRLLEQEKDSTAIKQMLLIAYFVIHTDFTRQILRIVFENKRKNKRLGIMEFE